MNLNGVTIWGQVQCPTKHLTTPSTTSNAKNELCLIDLLAKEVA